MDEIKKTDTITPGPINLDPRQLEQLDKLIGSLKREIIFPEKRKIRDSAASEAGN